MLTPKNEQGVILEFEYVASNFLSHQHDVRECDLVICWKNDIGNTDFPLPIIQLSAPDFDVRLADDMEKELFYWKSRALSGDRKIATLENLLLLQNDKNNSVSTTEMLRELSKLERSFGFIGQAEIAELLTLDKRERIMKLQRCNGNHSQTEIAKMANCTPQYVSKIIKTQVS